MMIDFKVRFGRNRQVMVWLLCAFSAISAFGHAILVESVPRPNEAVVGPQLAITLKFNVRIDALRSRMQLVGPDGSSRTLQLQRQASADTLNAGVADLHPGRYKLMWQVLASDGHITQGEFYFTVR